MNLEGWTERSRCAVADALKACCSEDAWHNSDPAACQVECLAEAAREACSAPRVRST